MGVLKKKTSVTLTPVAVERLAEIASGLGLSRSAALEVILRQHPTLSGSAKK
jgi:Ribbon-helix-helix protein, copG family